MIQIHARTNIQSCTAQYTHTQMNTRKQDISSWEVGRLELSCSGIFNRSVHVSEDVMMKHSFWFQLLVILLHFAAGMTKLRWIFCQLYSHHTQTLNLMWELIIFYIQAKSLFSSTLFLQRCVLVMYLWTFVNFFLWLATYFIALTFLVDITLTTILYVIKWYIMKPYLEIVQYV